MNDELNKANEGEDAPDTSCPTEAPKQEPDTPPTPEAVESEVATTEVATTEAAPSEPEEAPSASTEEQAAETVDPETPQMAFCRACGAPLDPGKPFCSSCGTAVNPDAPSPAAGKVTTQNAAASATKTPHLSKAAVGGILAVAVVAVIGIGIAVSGAFAPEPEPEPFDFSEEFDEYEGESWCLFGDDGSYMTIDTNPYDYSDDFDLDAYEAIEEVNEELGFPDSTFEKMGRTRAVDGTQSDETDGFEVSWTYHPDNGMEVTYTRVEESED